MLLLPEYPSIKEARIFEQLQTGSVLIIENGAVIINSNDRMVLTLPSAKYSKL